MKCTRRLLRTSCCAFKNYLPNEYFAHALHTPNSCMYVCMYVCILYLKINSYKQSTLASSTRVGFHERRRVKKNYLQGIYKKIGVTLANTKDKR